MLFKACGLVKGGKQAHSKSRCWPHKATYLLSELLAAAEGRQLNPPPESFLTW